MVGDAQIGKTSLMVKYVEGSWDEDYIQTLGMAGVILLQEQAADRSRGQLHGENYLNTQHGNHIFNLGSRRPKGIRQYAPPSLQ